MISILASSIIIAAAFMLTLTTWRKHLSRQNSSAFFWFVNANGTGRTTIVTFIVAVAFWQMASDIVDKAIILPTPLAAFWALWEMATWELLINVLITSRRIFVALTIATFVGVSLGLLAGLFPWIGRIVLPVNSALR